MQSFTFICWLLRAYGSNAKVLQLLLLFKLNSNMQVPSFGYFYVHFFIFSILNVFIKLQCSPSVRYLDKVCASYSLERLTSFPSISVTFRAFTNCSSIFPWLEAKMRRLWGSMQRFNISVWMCNFHKGFLNLFSVLFYIIKQTNVMMFLLRKLFIEWSHQVGYTFQTDI